MGVASGRPIRPALPRCEVQRHLPGADVLYADTGYDAVWVHEMAQEDWGVATAIPPVKHKAHGPPGAFYRSQMTDC